MQEYELSVLEQYDMDVSGTRKVRGAVLCDTDKGLFLLKEVPVSENRIPVLRELYDYLAEQGYENTDSIIPNKEGNCVSTLEDGGKYILKKWFSGRECDIRKPGELLEAAGNLAKLHVLMQKEMSGEVMAAEKLEGEYLRHNRELKKVRQFVRKQSPKGEFECAFLKCFDQMYRWAEAAQEMLSLSGYQELYEGSVEHFCMVHGEYNYHNILMKTARAGSRSGMAELEATTNFDKFKRDIQVEDLYYFLRKVMEKHGWKERLGDNMMNAYSAIKPLSAEETEYIKLRLVYPEKFWKVADSYYHSNKAWISVKSIEKINTAIRQTKEKERFLSNIFTFHL